MTPDDHTNQEFQLDVGDGHTLYVQDWGNKTAKKPIVFLHGGPGAGVSDGYKSSFEPAQQRVIFFDQRGSGKSTPYGSLDHNTTADLVEDIEKLAESLSLDNFILSGGSWGACLALSYALKYPKRVIELVIRGIFTGSRAEIDWLENGIFSQFFPDVWQKFQSTVPAEQRQAPVQFHYKLALGEDPVTAKASAYEIHNLEGALISLDDRRRPMNYQDFDPSSTIIEIHYLINHCFMDDRYIIDNAHRLTMPIWLIQGRYDMVCPPTIAYQLHQHLPNSQLIWTMAGHGNDRSNYDVYRTLLLQLADN